MSRAIALKTIETEKGFLGTTEHGGNNAGEQVERFQKSAGIERGDPWCAAFQDHCLKKSAGFLGLTLPPTFPDSGYCPDYQAWAKRNGKWLSVADVKAGKDSPRPGDLCLFYFSAKGRVAHIGMVTSVNSGGDVFTTIEGNTSDETGVDRDGDGVFPKHRILANLGTLGGFVKVDF